MGHLSKDELQDRISHAIQQIEVGGTYYHYKDIDKRHPYQVVSIGLLEANEQPVVIYQEAKANGLVWVRPLKGKDGWLDQVEVGSGLVSRFQKS